MFDPREIGHRIKQRREELDLTLEDVASAVKVARSTIQRYEAGTIGRPKLPVLYSISQALCVSPDWLLGIIDEPPPPLCGWDGSTLRDLRKITVNLPRKLPMPSGCARNYIANMSLEHLNHPYPT